MEWTEHITNITATYDYLTGRIDSIAISFIDGFIAHLYFLFRYGKNYGA